ncbi:hypothetical protein [Xylanibacter muris]|uniref:hypothetical protein n=1 Tax=Xylanibacter muris TaxID=2736290 RepID=UPI000FFE6AFF|nr:hypothetical protein [Xylanibacter muris]RXE71575.1 hypothetical protein ED352_04525 [Muribaculaceae bacterium Isolate-002 (NCI)]
MLIEILSHFASVIFTAVVIFLIILLINRYERKRHEKYHITIEYRNFLFYYSNMEDCLNQLNELGADGWEIATCAGEDSFAAYLILKRETLHTSKSNGK